MTGWRLSLALLAHSLREARLALVLAGILLAGLCVIVGRQWLDAERYDPFGSRRLGDDMVCRSYDGARVCFPASKAVKRHREEQREGVRL